MNSVVNSGMKIGALIPVKGFHGAKQRLSPQLGAHDRSELMKAMVHDVLTEVTRARGVHETCVVTGSAAVVDWVSAMRVAVIREQEETGETAAVHLALDVMKEAGMEAVLVLPGDIPLVRAEDVESVLRAAPARPGKHPHQPFVVLTPSHDRMGTNALLLAPPDVLRLRFGHDSFRHHLNQAATRGAVVKVVENARIALDVDEPADLQQVVRRLQGGRTRDRLAAMKDRGGRFCAEAG